MSSFTTPAELRFVDGYQFELLAPFEFHVGAFPSVDVITVPAGFVTDLASVHDYLYSKAIGSKAYADSVFLEGMTVLGVPAWKRKVMHTAVRLFGRGAYPPATKEMA